MPEDVSESPELRSDSDEASSVEPCPNCESLSVENFCANCGQQTGSLHIPVRVFVGRALARLFALDSRTWQTLIFLLRHPGLLTRHYLDGKRARYIAPLRLYLFISFVTFLLLTITPNTGSPQFEFNGTDSTAAEQTAPDEVIGVDSLRLSIESDDSTASLTYGYTGEQSGDSTRFAIEADEDARWLVEFFRPAVEDPDRMLDSFMRRLPWVFFFVMPIFAGVLQVLYRRRESYYVPHLIFTLHAYSAGFLMVALGEGLDALLGVGFFSEIAVVGILLHLFLSLRRVYSQGKLLTIFKEICLVVAAMLLSIVSMLIVLLYVILVM